MKTALVLGGGGARGAYEAGVVSYLRDELGPRLRRPARLDVLCGTSVGAITCCLLASTAAREADQGRLLRALWSRLTIDRVLQLGVTDFGRALWELGGGGLINPAGLRRQLLSVIDWRAIGRNLRAHRLDAICVTTTRVSDGRSCLFVQQADRGRPLWTPDPQLVLAAARIGPRHALASAAMPLLFAPVEIGGQLHLDGGLRLNVPLSPALHLGARRVIVVSMQAEGPAPAPANPKTVTGAFLAGKALNALMQDRTEDDVHHLRELNALAEAIGPTAPVRFVRHLVIRPSRDLGVLAHSVAADPGFCRRNRQLPGALVTQLARRESPDGADLASYLLFDPGYAEALIALGRADARAREAEWVRFFDDAPVNAVEAAAAEPGAPA